MRRKGLLLLAGLTLISASVGFFAFTASASAKDSETSQKSSRSDAITVTSVADAAQIADYDLAEPRFVPEGFTRSRISVIQLQTASRGPESRPAEFEWTSPYCVKCNCYRSREAAS